MQIEHVLDIIDRPRAWAWIRRHYLPDSVICPICGAIVTSDKAMASFAAMDRTYCAGHGGSFRATSAIAPLRGTEWTPEEFVKFLVLHLAGQQTSAIAALLGKSPACVRDMTDRVTVLVSVVPPGDRPLVERDKKGARRGGGAKIL